MAETLLARV